MLVYPYLFGTGGSSELEFDDTGIIGIYTPESYDGDNLVWRNSVTGDTKYPDFTIQDSSTAQVEDDAVVINGGKFISYDNTDDAIYFDTVYMVVKKETTERNKCLYQDGRYLIGGYSKKSALWYNNANQELATMGESVVSTPAVLGQYYLMAVHTVPQAIISGTSPSTAFGYGYLNNKPICLYSPSKEQYRKNVIYLNRTYSGSICEYPTYIKYLAIGTTPSLDIFLNNIKALINQYNIEI